MSLTVLVFVLGFLVTAALALLALILADRHRRRHLARMARARQEVAREEVAALPKRRRVRAHWLLRWERQLAQAGLRVSVGRLVAGASAAVLGLYALLLLTPLHPVLGAVVALALPRLGVTAWVAQARARYRMAFTNGLPEALDVFARGLRAGRPVADSLAIVVENAEGPVAREFTRCRDEMRLGTTLADTLARLNARMPTAEVSFFAVATALQAETGGNLIETMENLAIQLRERRKLRRKARALSSEARASAGILASLPFAVAGLLLYLNAGYLSPLWSDPRGQAMSALAVLSIGAGIALMTRMGKLNV